MTTLRGAIRSYSAAVKRAERANQKRAKESAKRFKAQQKQNEILNASQAVREYNTYVEVIQSVHKDVLDPIDWVLIKNEPEPVKPTPLQKHEGIALGLLKAYVPSLFDKIFGQKDKKIKQLKDRVALAIQKDKLDFDEQLRVHKSDLEQWNILRNIALGILNKDTNAYKEAIEFFNPFSELSELGSHLFFDFNADSIIIDIRVNNDSIIPNYILSQTSTGKLSKKNMPTSKFNELYQDYVCSCVLRVAREIFSHIPIQEITINAIGKLLSTSTGNKNEETILSVRFSSGSLSHINFQNIDPSDCINSFKNNMKFSKSNGFSAVSKLSENNSSMNIIN